MSAFEEVSAPVEAVAPAEAAAATEAQAQAPRFDVDKTVAHIKKVSADTSSFEFVVTAHLRMSGVYWGLAAMTLLGRDLEKEMGSGDIAHWVMSCYYPDSGGFGGNVGHDAHMLYTLSALQILAMCGHLNRVDTAKVTSYIASLQQKDGSVAGDRWGEVDTRFSYCALQALALLGTLPKYAEEEDAGAGAFSTTRCVQFLSRCLNFDGGFGAVPGAESHAGQIFCCVAALSIAQALHVVDRNLLGWWLAERQCDSGGLNGRPEKQADVCYSWWILSSLSILGTVSWIDGEKLQAFILEAQDPDDGGISDRPGNMGDIFHTFFGVAGLSLLGYFKHEGGGGANQGGAADCVDIDPTYALPVPLVEKMGLPRQTLFSGFKK